MLVLDHLQHAAGDVHLPHDSSGSGSGGSGSGSGGHVHGPGCSHGHAHSHGHSHSAPGLLGELPPGQNGSGSGGELVFESADLEQHRLLREREWEQQQGATGGSGGGGGGAPSRKGASPATAPQPPWALCLPYPATPVSAAALVCLRGFCSCRCAGIMHSGFELTVSGWQEQQCSWYATFCQYP